MKGEIHVSEKKKKSKILHLTYTCYLYGRISIKYLSDIDSLHTLKYMCFLYVLTNSYKISKKTIWWNIFLVKNI